ncbi:glycosyltransferase [Paenibacillus sp. JSM ZJ436]|uniref:glycosyltransferase n=1 Tax=Paenibacillus sp. JSM ZJ436 TaxID=3376190 RepID=UPI00379BE4D0
MPRREGGYTQLLHKHGITHYNLNQTRRPVPMLQAFFHFRKMLRAFQPDIIHAHMMTGALLSRLLKGFHKYKIITHVHNEFQKSATVMKVGDSVIAVSQAVAESMQRRGIVANKLHVVRNGTVGSRRNGSVDQVVLEGIPILTVAGMYRRKGIAELIEAFNIVAGEYEDTHLYLIGEGPDKLEFELQAQRSSYRHRIHFLGFQANPKVFMEAADIFVFASHKESFGLVLIEAREAGCAIVATEVDGIPETLDYGNYGLLVPPKSAEELSKGIMAMLKYPDVLNAYRTKASQGLEYYSVERVARDTLEIYQNTLIS